MRSVGAGEDCAADSILPGLPPRFPTCSGKIAACSGGNGLALPVKNFRQFVQIPLAVACCREPIQVRIRNPQ